MDQEFYLISFNSKHDIHNQTNNNYLGVFRKAMFCKKLVVINPGIFTITE